jgi:hypothetical protein
MDVRKAHYRLMAILLPVALICTACPGEESLHDAGTDADTDADTDTDADADTDADTDTDSDTDTDTDSDADSDGDAGMDASVCAESDACGTAGICSEGVCVDPWPPTPPWYTGTVCELPACDESLSLPFDYSGNWVLTTTTVSTTCNTIVQTADERFTVGAVHTGSAHPLNFIGGCDYQAGSTTDQMGTFASNVEVTCEVNARSWGTSSIETSVMTFQEDGTAAGTATILMVDIPAFALQAGNQCEIVMDVAMQRVPDCTGPGDCNDSISCTTDSCALDAGICEHELAADTCLIDGTCIADGAHKAATGDDSCRLCVGAPPSQYGWMVLGSGETCDDGDVGTTGETCQLGGICEVSDAGI